MARPRRHDEQLRTRLLEETSRLLTHAGPAAFTVREAARVAGTSTSAVYSLFGGREQLLNAVALEAVRRFSTHLTRVPRTDDPVADLLELGMAYRASALADPHFYGVMFGPAAPGAERMPLSPEYAEASGVTFEILRSALRRCVTDGRSADGGAGDGLANDLDATATAGAQMLWALVHGLVMLELSGFGGDSDAEREARFRSGLSYAWRGVGSL